MSQTRVIRPLPARPVSSDRDSLNDEFEMVWTPEDIMVLDGMLVLGGYIARVAFRGKRLHLTYLLTPDEFSDLAMKGELRPRRLH